MERLRLLRARVTYRTIRETVHVSGPTARPEPRSLVSMDVDIHTIEDHDSVMRDAYGYLSIVDVDGDVFLYPTTNIVKVDIVA